MISIRSSTKCIPASYLYLFDISTTYTKDGQAAYDEYKISCCYSSNDDDVVLIKCSWSSSDDDTAPVIDAVTAITCWQTIPQLRSAVCVGPGPNYRCDCYYDC